MKRNNRLQACFAILCLIIGIGCAKLHRTPNPDGTPTAPVTTLEQVNFDNAQIAIHNQTIAKAVVNVYQAGFLSKEYFNSLTSAQIRITRVHQKLTPLLAKSSSANSAEIRDLVKQIETIAAGMATDGTAGIKNPQSQQLILSEVNAISSLANSIIATLTASGVIQ